MSRLSFKISAKDKSARVGVLTLRHGEVKTPCFMPVGTRGAVKTLTSCDLNSLGAEIILGNTYHLMLRPGDELIARRGGLNKFTGWQKPILTDSGGFQILSLNPKITPEAAEFKSVYDGTQILLTPEKAVEVQANLGSDIQMALDVCPPLPRGTDVIANAVEITGAWAERARRAFLENPKTSQLAQFGIVQGGLEAELRESSARQIQSIGFEGYAIGGLSVGETPSQRKPIMELTAKALPESQPRYLMGVGDPLSLISAIACGIDMFDCVLPTRLARHATALTTQGRLNLKSSAFAEDDAVLDPGFAESPANNWSRSYLRHLFNVNEPSAGRILTLHNLAFLLDLMQRAREAISAGNFSELMAETAEAWRT